jgi:cell division protein FtsB
MSEHYLAPDAIAPEVALTRGQRVLRALRSRLGVAIFGAAMIGLLAVLYLNEVAAVAAANARLQTLDAEQTRLERQDAQLHEQLGSVTSPAYIDQHARAMGLTPAAPGEAVALTVRAATGGTR